LLPRRELLRSGLLCGPEGLRSVRCSGPLCSGLLRSEALLRSGELLPSLCPELLRGCDLLPEALPSSARSDLPAEDLLRSGGLRSGLLRPVVLRLGPGFRPDDGGPGSGTRPEGGPGSPGPQGPSSAGPQGSGSQVDLSVPDWTGRSSGHRST
jgi:hypothetical protein